MGTTAQATVSMGKTRIDGIDLLRGIAILFVVMNHVHSLLLLTRIPYTRRLPDQVVYALFWNGHAGVQIFFAVSGFLILSTTLRRWGSLSQVNIGDFYRLRFARIAPLLLLLLLILSGLHLGHVQGFIVQQKTGGLGRALFAALTFQVNRLEAHTGYLPGSWNILWSLSVEEMFYLFFPLLCRLLRRNWMIVGLLLCFVVLGPISRTVWFSPNEVWREYSYLGGMDAIALGCLTALLVAEVRLPRRALWALGGGGAALLGFSLGFSIRAAQWGLFRSGLQMTVIALGTCMVAAVAAQTRWTSPRIMAPLLWFGRRSYEIYLSHVFIVLLCFLVFLRLGRQPHAIPLLYLVVIAGTGLVGALIARLYTEPINRLLRKRFMPGGVSTRQVKVAVGPGLQ